MATRRPRKSNEGAPHTPVSVLVLGTGAMGSLLAARLARTGRAAVTVAGTWNAALERIDRRGITLDEGTTSWSVPVATGRLTERLGPVELVLVLVKSPRTAEVAPIAAGAVVPDGVILTLQNGLGNAAILARVAGSDRVAAGVTAIGATLTGPGQVRSGGAGLTVLGARMPSDEIVEHTAALFRDAGLETDVTADIERLMWRKLAVNCAINPLSALLAVPNGALLHRPEPRATLVAAAREVGAVAAAKGIDPGADPAELAVEVARQTATNRSSMLQDVERGVPTEIDAINGAVVREGRRLGVPTPVNEALWHHVRAHQAVAVGTIIPSDAAELESHAR